MITNPSSLTEQLLNLVERIATELKAIYNKLNKAVFKINGITPNEQGSITIDSVDKATKDSAGRVITETYALKSEKIQSSESADYAAAALKDALGNTISDTYATKTELGTKASIAHASSAPTYGMGTSINYGHVRLTDSTSSTSGSNDGIAASAKAVKDAYDLANIANVAAAISVKSVNGVTPVNGNVEIDAAGAGVHVGTDMPEKESINVWIDTDEPQKEALPITGGNLQGNLTITGTLTSN